MIARPGRMAIGSPRQNSTTVSRRGSSARWNVAGGATGSSREHHPAALDDPPDMAHSEVIKELGVVGNVANDEVRLLADFERAELVAAGKCGGAVQRQRGQHFGRLHLH